MTVVFWILIVATLLWYIGALVFVYHVFSFRYPRDITLPMLAAFALTMAPASLLLVGFLSDFYGSIY